MQHKACIDCRHWQKTEQWGNKRLCTRLGGDGSPLYSFSGRVYTSPTFHCEEFAAQQVVVKAPTGIPFMTKEE